MTQFSIVSGEVLEPHVLAQKVFENHRIGQGIIPLTGAGLSVPSGIPDGSELRSYLRLCVGLAVGVGHGDNAKAPDFHLWRPASMTWPARQGDWASHSEAVQGQIETLIALKPKPDSPCCKDATSFLGMCVQARAALTDWRLALQFLCGLQTRTKSRKKSAKSDVFESVPPKDFGFVEFLQKNEFEFEIVEGNPHLRDSLFRYITSSHEPCMAHRMLAHFAHPLRMKLILTLNFDSLLEQAMREIHLEPAVFEVHRDANLPTWSHLGNNTSVVKLHGGHWGLMADAILDRDPDETNRRNFRSYLIGEDWPREMERDNEEKKMVPVCNHLLVAGISGQDRRIRLFIRDALRKVEGLQVYWCCFSKRDEQMVREYFSSLSDDEIPKVSEAGGDNEHPKRGAIHLVRAGNLGLLLWEVYLKVTKAPPPSGLDFPVSWQTPMIPSSQIPESKAKWPRNCKPRSRSMSL